MDPVTVEVTLLVTTTDGRWHTEQVEIEMPSDEIVPRSQDGEDAHVLFEYEMLRRATDVYLDKFDPPDNFSDAFLNHLTYPVR